MAYPFWRSHDIRCLLRPGDRRHMGICPLARPQPAGWNHTHRFGMGTLCHSSENTMINPISAVAAVFRLRDRRKPIDWGNCKLGCTHPAHAQRQITIDIPQNRIVHVYCQVCGMHKINGIWKKRIVTEEKTPLFF